MTWSFGKWDGIVKIAFDSDMLRQLSTGRNVGRAENRPCARRACGKFGTQSLKKTKETLVGKVRKIVGSLSLRYEFGRSFGNDTPPEFFFS